MNEAKNISISASNFNGKRKAVSGEKEFLKCLMLEYAEGNGFKIIFLGILFSVAVFPWFGIRWIVRAVLNMYDIRYLQFSDVIIECIVCIVLCGIGVFGIYSFICAIKDYQSNTYRQDIMQELFLVVDVDVIDYQWNDNIEIIGSFGYAKIADCNGNIADHKFTTREWDEIEKTKKGLIVIFAYENGEEKVLYHLFPRYEENSPFCMKKKKEYEKKYQKKEVSL